MAKRDLNLNSLGRYGKSSSRLILEEHGHCEVPAGCGGVVLRWRNPNSGLIFLLRLFTLGNPTIYIDGAAPASGRPVMSFGDHVISFAIARVEGEPIVLAFGAIHDESQFGFPHASRPSSRIEKITTAADGTWKYSATEPSSEAWMRPGFDDADWQPMPAVGNLQLDEKDAGKYRLKAALETGAICLGVPGPAKNVWIRKAFTLRPLPA